MASNRIPRTNDDIQRVLSDVLRSIKDPRLNQGLISITRVDTTGDLSYSKIYISVLGQCDEKEFMKGLKSASGFIRRELSNSLHLRHTPTLVFELDHSIERGSHITDLITKLNTGDSDE